MKGGITMTIPRTGATQFQTMLTCEVCHKKFLGRISTYDKETRCRNCRVVTCFDGEPCTYKHTNLDDCEKCSLYEAHTKRFGFELGNNEE